MSGGHPAAGGQRAAFNPYVHGARGLFSFMVLVFHVANSGLPTFVYPGAAGVQFFLLSFKFGVELFFGISGIVILGALSRARSLPVFAWDRFTRIYPVLWATLAVVLVLGHLVHAPVPPAGIIALNFVIPPPGVVMKMLNPAAWSLSFELAFYLLCALAWQLRGRRGIVPLTVIVGLALIALFPRTQLMLPGVLIGVGLLRWRPVTWLSRFPIVTMALFLLLWNGIETVHGGQTGAISPLYIPFADWLVYVPLFVVAGVLGAASLLGIADGRGMAGRVLATRPAQWMGTVSYSFYLWHPIVLGVTKRVLIALGILPALGPATQAVLLLVGLPAALVVAWASQQLIEKRLTRWLRRRVEGPREAHTPMTSSPPLPGNADVKLTNASGANASGATVNKVEGR